MFKQVFSSEDLPKYHDGMLIVKMRPTASFESLAVRGTGVAVAAESPGMSALSFFERGGMIKRIVSLSPQTEAGLESLGGRRGIAVMESASAVADKKESDINTGVSIIELEEDKDVSEIQVAMANDPTIEFVSRVPVRYLVAKAGAYKNTSAGKKAGASKAGIAAVPPPASTLWNLSKISWKQARALAGFKDATKIRVAVLDTGVDRKHPDLKGRVKGYVFLHPDLPNASGENDIVGHGTHVSGTIAALINNSVGINGICQCQLFEWKIFTDVPEFAGLANGFQYFVDPIMYRRALADCIDQKMDVINLSIGGPGEPDHQESLLFNTLIANGTTVVAAMGNEREEGSPTSFPAAIPGVIAVGATNIDDTVASFSNRGNHITLSAPGKGIWSTLPTNPGQFGFAATTGAGGRPKQGKPFKRETNYDSWDGTSMATPHVTAAVALLLANKGKMSTAAVRAQLVKTVDKVKAMGGKKFDPDFGAGRLNLLRLLKE